MKANIKLSLVLPITVTILSILVNVLSLEYFNIIFILGALYIDVYYILSYIRRENALIINNDYIKIKTAFKTKEYSIKDLDDFHYQNGDNCIRVKYNLKSIILINDIYTEDLKNIYDHLIKLSNREANV